MSSTDVIVTVAAAGRRTLCGGGARRATAFARLALPLLLLLATIQPLAAKDKEFYDFKEFSDWELEKMYEKWEEDEEPLPVDELPDWDPRKQQPIDFSKIDMSNPDNFMVASKKGKTMMIFVKVSGEKLAEPPSDQRVRDMTGIWQTGLWNNHWQSERYMLQQDEIIYTFQDGSLAFEYKDYFIEQEGVESVTVDQKTYCGRHALECKEDIDHSFEAKEKRKKKEEEEKAAAKKKKEKKKDNDEL